MTGSYCTVPQDVARLHFSHEQAYALDKACRHVSRLGGPDVSGSAALSTRWAQKLKERLTEDQRSLLSDFADGQVCAIEFGAMLPPCTDPVPDSLPPLNELTAAPEVIYLASRHQILLGLVGYRSFAFDIDNDGKQLRLVGNFKGGGHFSRSECFIKDDGPPPEASSILQFDEQEEFTLRYSTYRYSLDEHATTPAKNALHTLQRLVGEVASCTFTLDSRSALLINNSQALHGREIIQDNRRLLIRLFAYALHTQPLVLQSDPLVVRG